MPGATRSIGTILRKTSGTPFTVGGLTNIGEVGIESGEIDVTSLDSSNQFKEYIRGFKDTGEMPIEGFVKDDVVFANMYNLAKSGTVEHWEITTVDGAKMFFYAFVKMFKKAEDTVEGARGYTGSLRVTSEPVYAENGISA